MPCFRAQFWCSIPSNKVRYGHPRTYVICVLRFFFSNMWRLFSTSAPTLPRRHLTFPQRTCRLLASSQQKRTLLPHFRSYHQGYLFYTNVQFGLKARTHLLGEQLNVLSALGWLYKKFGRNTDHLGDALSPHEIKSWKSFGRQLEFIFHGSFPPPPN